VDFAFAAVVFSLATDAQTIESKQPLAALRLSSGASGFPTPILSITDSFFHQAITC
jgi:hypothetical protein